MTHPSLTSTVRPRLPLLAFAVGLALIFAGLTAPADASVTTSPGGTMIAGPSAGTSQPLVLDRTDYHSNGMQVGHFTNGLSVAGGGGETVSYNIVQETEANGEAVTTGAIGVRPREEEEDEPAATWTAYDALVALGATAEEMNAMGVSAACPHIDDSECVTTLPPLVQEDGTTTGELVLAGHSKKGAWIGTPKCHRIDTSHVRSYGCAIRKWHSPVGEHKYFSTSSEVTGASKGIHNLVRLRTSHMYHNATKLFKPRPIDDVQNDSDCYDLKLSLEYNNVGASATGRICKSKWDMTPPEPMPGDSTSAVFTNSWYRWGGVQQQDRSAAAVNMAEKIASKPGFEYKTYYTWMY